MLQTRLLGFPSLLVYCACMVPKILSPRYRRPGPAVLRNVAQASEVPKTMMIQCHITKGIRLVVFCYQLISTGLMRPRFTNARLSVLYRTSLSRLCHLTPLPVLITSPTVVHEKKRKNKFKFPILV